jgi:hypothetical protein
MTVREAHYQFQLNLDRVSSFANPGFNPGEIDTFLNEAYLIFIKQRTGINNATRSGFETSQKRIDDLGALVIKFPEQPAMIPVEVSSGILEIDLTKTSEPYLTLINAYANVIISSSCTLKIPLKFVQHDDFNETMRDPFQKNNREFIPYNVGRNSSATGQSIYVYTDLNVESVVIEYIKYPKRISIGTYTHMDGITYPNQTFETLPQTHIEIVDIACQLAALSTQSPEYLQTRTQKLLVNE